MPRQTLFALRRSCHRQLAEIGEEAASARGLAFAAVGGKLHPEYEALLLLDAARQEEERTGVPWWRALRVALASRARAAAPRDA